MQSRYSPVLRLEKKQESKYHYLGDYMNQYSWPEVMHAELDEISWSFDDE